MTHSKKLSDVLMDPNDSLANYFFKILVSGNFRQNQLLTIYIDEKAKYSPIAIAEIEEEWSQVVSRYPKAFPGPLVRLNAFGVDSDGNLSLELGPSNYKEYRWSVNLPEEERRNNNYNLANPLAAGMMIYSRKAFEGKGGLLFSQRSDELAHHPGGLEFPGGNVGLEDLDENGKINPVTTALRETKEEQGITEEELENIRVLGMAYEYFQDAAPTLVVVADLKDDVSFEGVINRQGDSEGRAVWLPADPGQLVKNTLEYSIMCSPFVLAGVYFFLKPNYPDEAEYFIQELQKQGDIYKKLSVDELTEVERKKRAEFKF